MDYTSNFLTSLRNAEMASHLSLQIPSSKSNLEISRILKTNNYILDYSVIENTPQNKIEIKLLKNKKNHNFKQISKHGRRIYTNVKNIPRVLGGLGLVIISTPNGLLTGKEAKKQNVGGEIICEIY